MQFPARTRQYHFINDTLLQLTYSTLFLLFISLIHTLLINSFLLPFLHVHSALLQTLPGAVPAEQQLSLCSLLPLALATGHEGFPESLSQAQA